MSDEKDFKEEEMVKALANGDKTLNEVREELDLPPIKYGDVSLNPEDHKPEPTAKKVRPVPPQMITFDRYFLSLGRPMHHRAGLEAYKNTKGKKTLEAWKKMFADY